MAPRSLHLRHARGVSADPGGRLDADGTGPVGWWQAGVPGECRPLSCSRRHCGGLGSLLSPALCPGAAVSDGLTRETHAGKRGPSAGRRGRASRGAGSHPAGAGSFPVPGPVLTTQGTTVPNTDRGPASQELGRHGTVNVNCDKRLHLPSVSYSTSLGSL